jgi:hypothetical protein
MPPREERLRQEPPRA